MINSIEDGGLNIQDLECKLKSLKINWIKQLACTEYMAPWKSYLAQYFKSNIENITTANIREKIITHIL
jgi:hypothetical protein